MHIEGKSDLDGAFDACQRIVNEAAGNLPQIKTEEDVKVQIITRILTEVLGWGFKDIGTERKHENGFSDFVLTDAGTECLLVEAKRIGEVHLSGQETERLRHLKISGPGLKGCLDGIEQAAGYALGNGIEVAVLTDGVVWVVFKTFVPGESYKSKKAFVFPSLDSILGSFEDFFDLLAKPQFRGKVFKTKFDILHERRHLLAKSLNAPIERASIHLERKSDLAFDLEPVFDRFFDRLGAEDDAMLVECFVETRESRIADFSLEKITAKVLGNLAAPSKDVDRELSSLIEKAVKVESGQTVFIVGPTGAGKSTFLTRFFQKTLAPVVRRDCLVTRINCLDFSGVPESTLSCLTDELVDSLEKQIFKDGLPTFPELQGLYHHEYERRARGVHANLYKRDKVAFKEKFGEFLDETVEKDREGYLRRILKDVVSNRHKLPILVVDNTDEFPLELKEQIFQFTQALARHTIHCLLIFPITDKSAWSFSKTDIFGIYQSRSFFLPTPPPREVFRKRIGFLKERLTDEKPEEMRKEYFIGQGINLSIRNLDAFAEILESVFVDQDYTSRTIGELSNYNIRRTMLLSKRVITSAALDVEDLLKSYFVGKITVPDYSRFLEALIKGDYSEYLVGDCPELFPVFEVDDQYRESPLTALRILALLDATRRSGRDAESRHLSVQSIVDYFEAAGCPDDAVDRMLKRLFEAGLIEAFDLSIESLSSSQRLAISHCGKAHLRLATLNQVFFEQMALTTAISNEELAIQIRDEYKSEKPLTEKMASIRAKFVRYLLDEDASHISMNYGLGHYVHQGSLIEDLRRIARPSYNDEEAVVAVLGDEYRFGVFKSKVLATIDYIDRNKGFGFAVADGVDGQIFFHASRIGSEDFERISDGDQLVCDLCRDKKGVHISAVYDLKIDVEEVTCNIIRLFPDRNYGFVGVSGGTRDAFFHYSTLSEKELGEIAVGCSARVEVSPDKDGKGLQVRRFLSIDLE